MECKKTDDAFLKEAALQPRPLRQDKVGGGVLVEGILWERVSFDILSILF